MNQLFASNYPLLVIHRDWVKNILSFTDIFSHNFVEDEKIAANTTSAVETTSVICKHPQNQTTNIYELRQADKTLVLKARDELNALP